MRFTFGVIFRYSFFHVDQQDPEVSFKPLLGMSSLHGWFFDHGVKSPRHAAGGGHDVRCLHEVVADCSRHRWDRSSWFCVRSGMWITTKIQLRTWIVDTGIAHTQETSQTTHLDMFGGMPSKKKRKVAFFIATRADMCKMQSAMGGREDKGSQCSAPVPRPMTPTVDFGAPQYNAADILQLV